MQPEKWNQVMPEPEHAMTFYDYVDLKYEEKKKVKRMAGNKIISNEDRAKFYELELSVIKENEAN